MLEFARGVAVSNTKVLPVRRKQGDKTGEFDYTIPSSLMEKKTD
jgi:hypothetical protein